MARTRFWSFDGWAGRACLAAALMLVPVSAFAQDETPEADAPAEATEEAATQATEATESATQQASADEPVTSGEPDLSPVLDPDPMQTLETIWNATLFTAGDTEIKLNQIIIALLVALLGLWIAERITRFISGRLVKVSKISEPVADTLGKIMYYIGAAMVLLIAMQVAGIPTTVFTVLGGALAIGVGFGAQNLFNNLISGVIILTEKPIRRGDIVEIDGMEGAVAEIGNRRTRIRRTDGIDVLVPNSTFLETNVINWTLHDAKIRAEVTVGVAYGSPVEAVRDLLMGVAKEHAEVDQYPPPEVLFTEFGDNTLNFLMYVWTHVQAPLDRQKIESDLRFGIAKAFREAGIEIAFPQRDVHLDTQRPLEVRMIEQSD